MSACLSQWRRVLGSMPNIVEQSASGREVIISAPFKNTAIKINNSLGRFPRQAGDSRKISGTGENGIAGHQVGNQHAPADEISLPSNDVWYENSWHHCDQASTSFTLLDGGQMR